jgi:MHS family alpha-ketoglutarate permease-like MFS transporter
VFYAYTTLMPTYMKQVAHLAAGTVSTINFCALVVYMLLHPVLGLLSDRIGRKAMLMVSGIGGVLLTWPILTSLGTVQNPFAAFALQLLGLVIVCFYTSISAIVKAELFPTSIRALGVGLAYGLANAIFGGSAPYIGTLFIQAKNADGFIIYLIVLIAISLVVCIVGLKNKQQTPLDREYGQSYGTAGGAADKELAGSAR